MIFSNITLNCTNEVVILKYLNHWQWWENLCSQLDENGENNNLAYWKMGNRWCELYHGILAKPKERQKNCHWAFLVEHIYLVIIINDGLVARKDDLKYMLINVCTWNNHNGSVVYVLYIVIIDDFSKVNNYHFNLVFLRRCFPVVSSILCAAAAAALW